MRQLTYLTDARSDLADILRYVTAESRQPMVAQAFVAKLMSACQRLADLPGLLGTARPELLPDIRSMPCQGYVIFFRYRAERVEIVNILRGHRDVARHFHA